MDFCGGVFVVVFLWRCFCGGVFIVAVVVLRWCFCWWCFVVVFLWWSFCGGVVVFLWWKCDGVFVVEFLWWCFSGVDALLLDRAARRNRTDPSDEKKYRGARIKEVQKWWKTCQDWMAHYKTHSEPFVYDIKKWLKALSDKETVAQIEVDAFMENCAKRRQTRGYVPTQASTSARRSRLAWVSRCRYWYGWHLNMDNMEDYYMAEENLWGAERGAFVSPCFT